jgi:pimeloyl-ACP methyl ester carboxylesterase
MGGYVAAAAAPELQPVGLFLLAPALYMPDYPPLKPTTQSWKTTLVHGWFDDVIPVEHSIRYARACAAQLVVLNDGHRLLGDLAHLANLFDLFLGG